MHLIVEPVWNWWWIVLAAVSMIVLVLWTYPQRVQSLSPFWKWTLISLRLASGLVLLVTMIRPTIQIAEEDRRQSEMAVLMDSSRSMTTPDASAGLTRRQALLKMLQDNQQAWDQLGEEVELKLYNFAEDLTPVSEPTEEADGEFTAIGKVLDQLREAERGDRLTGILLLSDGAQRAGGEDDVDPLLAARRLSEEKGVAIHPVTLGTSELSTSGLDLSVDELLLSQPVTFEKKLVTVRLAVRMQGAAGQAVKVRLLMEDRTGKTAGESGELKPIPLTAETQPMVELQTRENSGVQNVELSFIADQPGDYKIAGEVVPLDGEVKLNNNRLETLITVRKGGLKVAYFDSIRTESTFIRKLNQTAKIQLDTQLVLAGERGQQSLIDPKLFAPGAYDVYLIGDVPASAFQFQGQSLLPELAKRVREGAGLGMIGGLRNFGAGGYATTPLAELLPVRMSPAERLGPEDNPSRNQITQPLKVLPTRDGERRYLMQLSSLENDQVWRRLPSLSGATKIWPKSGAVEILAESERNEPLIIASDTGRGRVLAMGVDETWRWHLRGFRDEHQRFWQQVMLWLARKEFDTDQPVWARVEPRNFSPFATVPIEFGAQDQNGQPIPDAQFSIDIIPPGGEAVSVSQQRTDEGGRSDFVQTGTPGDYWVRVSATKDGASLGMSAMTRFVVDARDIELDNPAADPGLMDELASLTGGSVIPPEEFGNFLRSLLEEGIPSELKRYRRIQLWDNWGVLLLFTSLMSMEWGIRKWKGLV